MPKEDTQFKPGESGNPAGRPKGVSLAKVLSDELSEHNARMIIRAIIRKAKKGDVQAFIQLIERTDGKVATRIDLGEYVREKARSAGLSDDDVEAAVREATALTRGGE